MKKVLIAVDETEGSKAVLSVFKNMVRPPESVVLVHVQQLEGKSMMIDMLRESELNTFREAIRGTEYKETQDRRSEKILNFYRKELENGGLVSVKTVVRDGIMWYFTWILGVLLACAFGITNVMWMESEVMLGKEKD